MSFFILFISFLVIVIAMSGLYLCSGRQIKKTLQGRWAYFAKHAKTTQCVAPIYYSAFQDWDAYSTSVFRLDL